VAIGIKRDQRDGFIATIRETTLRLVDSEPGCLPRSRRCNPAQYTVNPAV